MHQVKDAISPNLATFSNHEDSKIYDFQSNIQIIIPWISLQDFDLILFLYKYTSEPYSCIREFAVEEAIATLKKTQEI